MSGERWALLESEYLDGFAAKISRDSLKAFLRYRLTTLKIRSDRFKVFELFNSI